MAVAIMLLIMVGIWLIEIIYLMINGADIEVVIGDEDNFVWMIFLLQPMSILTLLPVILLMTKKIEKKETSIEKLQVN
ncbi:hypothetical protein DSAG12_02556 [Promethearchaeum syntrophicum]|uniref:Uncharacterized protein n=1 Tax=Promethearchaeum syntrophicum TaxID=2594042 RepID=A0A5B9DDD4_9ARCH|nr:hypothetical protein [Candidatus Prometheoarchaeum syntrophicum]